jgi:hypothetical protein
MNKLHCPYVKNYTNKKKEKNSKKHFQISIAIDVPLIFEDSFSISLQDDILEAQRLTQRDQGRGPSLQQQKDQQHLPCETSRNKKNQHNLLSTPLLNISEKFKRKLTPCNTHKPHLV